MGEKKYIIPRELQEIIIEGVGAESCMERAVKGYFKYQLRNAIFFGKKSRELKNKFWRGVYDLYPELEGKNMSYDDTNNILTVKGLKNG